MRTWSLIIFVACIPAAAIADDCERNQAQVLEILPGQDGSNGVHFKYESRRERLSRTTNKYVWCIEADSANQNVAEFRWGTTGDECRYMCALIEPGKGSPTVKSDPSKHFQFDRIIRFTRKNREEWHSLTPKTVSSKVIGEAGQDAIVLKTQFTDSDFDAFTDDDGLIQIDKLSTDPKAFLAFLSKEGQVRSGGSLTITLPTSQKVADLLRANHYENYDKADFVRVVTTVDSSILYNKGAPLLTYSIAVRPESKESAAALDPLMEQGLVAVRIAQRESVALPFASQSFVARNTERFLVSSTKLDPPVSYFPAKVEVTFGKELTVGGTEVPLFAPRQ